MTMLSTSPAPRLLGATLVAHGYDAGDFELEQDPEPDLREALGLTDGLMLLRRRSTGAVRFYLGASWYAAMVQDLAAGEFGHT